MRIVFSEDHRKHFAQGEVYGGELVTPFERPSRMEYILRELKRRKHERHRGAGQAGHEGGEARA
jgi:hypothetical protein